MDWIAQHSFCGWVAAGCLFASVWPVLLARRAADNFDKLSRVHREVCNDLRVSEIHLAETRMERDRLRARLGMEHPRG